MTLDASGNLGVGISPSDTNVYGRALDVASTTGAALYLRDSDSPTTQYAWLGYDGTNDNLSLYNRANGPMRFGTNNTERARITSGGEFAVNDTNPAGYSAQLLSVSTSASKFAGVFYGNAASNDGQAALQVAKSSSTNTSSQVLVEFYINAFNTASGRIVANGASAAAFASFSDERLKENIADLPSQLDNILALRPVEFDFKDGSGHQIGFIAQEFREVYPDAVAGEGDEMLTLVGWTKTEARLVKAIQELNAKNASLEARLAALEN
jgi:hypothetical protein